MTQEQIIIALRNMPFHWAARWCEPGEGGCGCMGCANGSGGLARNGVTRDQWQAAMKAAFAQFSTDDDRRITLQAD